MNEGGSRHAKDPGEQVRKDFAMVARMDGIITNPYFVGLEKQITDLAQTADSSGNIGEKTKNESLIQRHRMEEVFGILATYKAGGNFVLQMTTWAFNLNGYGFGLMLFGSTLNGVEAYVEDKPFTEEDFDTIKRKLDDYSEPNPFRGRKHFEVVGANGALAVAAALEIGSLDRRDTRFFEIDDQGIAQSKITAKEPHTFVVIRNDNTEHTIKLGDE